MSDETKADPDMDTRTLKACAGMTTNPIPVDDGESTKKEAKLVTSAFDRTKYKTKKRQICAPRKNHGPYQPFRG